MSEYNWGISYNKPTRAMACKMDKICREEGGYGLTEINVQEGTTPGINNGRYQRWFCGPNRGWFHDSELSDRVNARIEKECRK